MGRTFAIVVTAAVVGGIAGAAIGIAVDGGRSSSSNPTAAPVVAEPTSVVHTVAALSPEAIYRADSPAVVEIEDTVTQVVPPTFFTPGGTEQVGALGSGFVVDRKGDIVTNDHVVQRAGGDSIVAVNGKPVASSGQLSDRLAPFSPGDHVQLTVVRGSATWPVDVTLGNVPG